MNTDRGIPAVNQVIRIDEQTDSCSTSDHVALPRYYGNEETACRNELFRLCDFDNADCKDILVNKELFI